MAGKRTRPTRRLPFPLIALGVVLIAAAGLIFLFQNGRTGGRPALSVDKESIVYGDVKLGTELTFEIKVTNTGDGVLRFKEQPSINVLEGC